LDLWCLDLMDLMRRAFSMWGAILILQPQKDRYRIQVLITEVRRKKFLKQPKMCL
jgi:hypothetical protein